MPMIMQLTASRPLSFHELLLLTRAQFGRPMFEIKDANDEEDFQRELAYHKSHLRLFDR